MNRDTIKRLQEAKKYQGMAVKALFPERTAAHIEVIEREVKAIVMECMLDFLNQEECSQTQEQEGKDKTSKVKKVTIE